MVIGLSLCFGIRRNFSAVPITLLELSKHKIREEEILWHLSLRIQQAVSCTGLKVGCGGESAYRERELTSCSKQ